LLLLLLLLPLPLLLPAVAAAILLAVGRYMALRCNGLTVGIRSSIDICASVRLLAPPIGEYRQRQHEQIEMTTSICSMGDQRLNKESDCQL
jgi:hypothetical protein